MSPASLAQAGRLLAIKGPKVGDVYLPGQLSPSEMVRSINGVYISPSKPAFTTLSLALEFFLLEAKDPHLAAHPRDSLKTWDMTLLLCPILSYNKSKL